MANLRLEGAAWPRLDLDAWKDTYQTLHMWAQIVGKVRLALSPYENHWWQTALYVSSQGLMTSPVPYDGRIFKIEFNFINHTLSIVTAEGQVRIMALAPRSVADFYQEFMELIHSLGINVNINPHPQEVPNPIPFDQDHQHASYDRKYAHRFWRVLIQVDRLFKEFKGGFIGKCSPVHFFWGSFDLAVTRFSGRRAPDRPGVDKITAEAYSHEVISAGFWPGSGNIQGAAFYAYAAPEPVGYKSVAVSPPAAFYNSPTGGFILMYDDVRNSNNPDQMVLEFLHTTYEIGAELGKWDRPALERNFRVHKVA